MIHTQAYIKSMFSSMQRHSYGCGYGCGHQMYMETTHHCHINRICVTVAKCDFVSPASLSILLLFV